MGSADANTGILDDEDKDAFYWNAMELSYDPRSWFAEEDDPAVALDLDNI